MNLNQDKFLPYALPEISEEEISEVTKCLKSGWLTTGKVCEKFESEFSNFLESKKDSIAVNSATAGLHLALKAIGINAGDEVITTVHTFTATAEVIVYLGAKPVFVDINLKDLCIDANLVEKAITHKTKAIIPVHFAGHAAELDKIYNIAEKFNLYVIEDAAHALPCSYGNKLIGTSSKSSAVFSFYANKTMTTGEGGMVVSNNIDVTKEIKIYRTHGINKDAFARYTSKKPSWYYEIVAPGYKYNLTDIAASIGRVQLKKLLEMHKKREDIAFEYDTAFEKMPLILPPRLKGEIHSWHLYIVRLKGNLICKRDDIIQSLFEEGIGCSVHYIPLHRHPYWRDTYNLKKNQFKNSEVTYLSSISLPIYSKMKKNDVMRVISTLKKVLNIYRNA